MTMGDRAAALRFAACVLDPVRAVVVGGQCPMEGA